VVPSARIQEVFSAANERARGEKAVLKELMAGKSVRSVWDEYGLL
jgi:regulator of RNase E activity RraA